MSHKEWLHHTEYMKSSVRVSKKDLLTDQLGKECADDSYFIAIDNCQLKAINPSSSTPLTTMHIHIQRTLKGVRAIRCTLANNVCLYRRMQSYVSYIGGYDKTDDIPAFQYLIWMQYSATYL